MFKALLLIILGSVLAFLSLAAKAQSNPVPLINLPLLPDSVAPGTQQFTLTANGTSFVSGSTVNWNGAPLATKFVSSSQLTAIVPSSNVAVPGTAAVTVSTPGPSSVTTTPVLFTIATPIPAISFDSSTVSTGAFPSGVVAADLNGDTKTDLITVNYADSAVSVLLGNGDGTFQTQHEYSVADSPGGWAVVADFNNDGKPDLAVSSESGFVSILLGNGDGTFQPHHDFSVPGVATFLASADFNGDGKLDVAVSMSVGGVAILLGNGDGTLQTATTYAAGSVNSTGIAVGDFDQDGKLDLAVGGFQDSAVAILLGNGDGSFRNAVLFSTGSGPDTVIAADVNADGKLDLIVKDGSGGSFGAISVLLGTGNGDFPTHVDYQTPPSSAFLAVAEMNGDGALDLIVPSFTTHTLLTFLGQQDGTFKVPGYFATGRNPEGVAVADFTGDGRLDVVTANSADNTVSVLPQVTAVLSRTLVNFGTVPVGQTSTFKISFTNYGEAPLTISSISLTGSKRYFRLGNNCGSTLAPGASCTVAATFKPKVRGRFTGVINIVDSAAKQPQTVALEGVSR